MTQNLFGRGPDDQSRIELLAITIQRIRRPRPDPKFIQEPRHVPVTPDSLPVNRSEHVAAADTCLVRGTLRNNQTSLDPLHPLDP